MKLHLQGRSSQNAVTSYGPGFVAINGERYTSSLIVLPDRLITDWGASTFESLAAPHFERLARLGCEVILFGSGTRMRFPPRELKHAVIAANIGFEVMDTQAACRTYNILMGEDRKVAAALLVE